MLRYLNTHNGLVVNVPEAKAPRYDRATNMVRLDPDPEPILDLEALTVAQLRAHAQEQGIDLAGAERKAEIIDRIASAPPAPVADPLAEPLTE